MQTNDWNKNRAFNIFTPVVIGYAGGDHSLMSYLVEKIDNLKGLYWCYLKGNPPSLEVMRMFQEKKNCSLVEIDGFDSLMYLIGDAFEYPEPSFGIGIYMSRRTQTRIKDYGISHQKLHDNHKLRVQELKKAADHYKELRQQQKNIPIEHYREKQK